MKRRYRAARFADLVSHISERIPDCGIGCGRHLRFPRRGRTRISSVRSSMVERLPVTYVHAFTYSPRPGSEAANFTEQVPGDVAKRRTRALKRLAADKHRSFARRHVGRVVDVLLEPSRRGGTARIGGWTDNYLRVDLGEGTADARHGADCDYPG